MKKHISALRRAHNHGANVPRSFRLGSVLKNRAGLAVTVGATLVLGGLLIQQFGEKFVPAKAVRVESVLSIPPVRGEDSRVARAGFDPYSADVLFQSSGWLEPDPYVIKAATLLGGVVDKVHYLEGQSVQAGAVLATLVDDDARINLRAAEAALEKARAEAKMAAAGVDMAIAEKLRLEKERLVASRRLAELADLAERAVAMGEEVIPEREITQAVLQQQTQEARLNSLEAALERGIAEVQLREAALVAARAFEGERAEGLAMRRLEFDRTRVRAPITGIIQRLFVAPGQKRMLQGDDMESATIAWIYDPEKLQARIDVPLADASGLFKNQAVLIETELLPQKAFRGYVTRIVGEADLQRNTLQVKVTLLDPDPRMRPEVLCRAKFLDSEFVSTVGRGQSGEVAASNSGLAASAIASGRLRIFVPRTALSDVSGREAAVFVVDASGKRVEQRRVELGTEEREQFIEVLNGLFPGDRVAVEGIESLREGNRIKPVMNES